MRKSKLIRLTVLSVVVLIVTSVGVSQAESGPIAINTPESARLAITDLCETFGTQYPDSARYLQRLERIERTADTESAKLQLRSLITDALLTNPLLDFDRLIVLKRKKGQLGLPVNHKCNSGIKQNGYDNEIAILDSLDGDGKLRTLFRPKKGFFVGEIDLNFDGKRLLFTMPNGRTWQIHEIGVDGRGLRQVSQEHSGVDNFDACYLPDGRIVFASTASFHAVPCWHGKERACAIYQMNAHGADVRQLCFDQDLDLHPSVLPTGQVVYSRWDYSGPMHMYLRPLMAMNPDGTGQRALYGSNSYWPNALYYPRGIPGHPNKIIAIIAGYHGAPRMGELGLIDLTLGSHEADGIAQRIPGRGRAVKPVIRDNLIDNSWPKFLHPYPLSDKYFLVASQPAKNAPWGIYLVDVFDNMIPICIDAQYDFFEPIPLTPTAPPPIVPDKVDLTRDDAIVYLHDVYAGPGLAGVPNGTIKQLRIIAYEFGYPGMAGPDKIGSGGPWEVMRILGTVPVNADGSVMFRAPANTPLSVQALDADGAAVQLMRSWFTAMPGETVSCVGCHEKNNQVPAAYGGSAARSEPAEITPWLGPARGFDFADEIQPVLDKYCIGCHNGKKKNLDLRPLRLVKDYKGRQLAQLGRQRLHPDVKKTLGGTRVKYTPAYEALLPFIRRVGIEDDIHLLPPGEYHVDTSQLIQMLEKDHHGVRLNDESWRRLYAWIDLNAPCHGSWSQVAPIPDNADKRRKHISRLYGNLTAASQQKPKTPVADIVPIIPSSMPPVKAATVNVEGWPFDEIHAKRLQRQLGVIEKNVDIGGGVTVKLMRIPAGEFITTDDNEQPLRRATIEKPFWIGAFEITNAQYRLFDPSHNSGYFSKRYQGKDGPGLSLDAPEQPAVRVSWNRAVEFCKWLSDKTHMNFSLPTEQQWEYACRAGTSGAFCFGDLDSDFSKYANLADKSLSIPPAPTGGLASNITQHKGNGIFLSALRAGNVLCDDRFSDGAVVTANVGAFRPNTWGLYDTHGNAAEWTLSKYTPDTEHNKKVVRGGSFHDHPKRAQSSFKLGFLPWNRPFNAGFRIVSDDGYDLAADK